jgi:peptidoglycan/LPS O-acetylase OafA/YrhL
LSSTPYRPDIDGLRALAIIPVVAYHAWPAIFPGGFVGVDIFFVISGFLITRIILAPGFSFSEFYCRRVRRIFPALLLVLAATLVLGGAFLPPDSFHNLLAHAIGGGLFVANFVSYHDAGYFSGASDLKPLVHLWSLGVEEQFYLLWPVLVWVALRRGVLTRAIALGAVASFALFVWLSEADPRAAFFLSPSRFWELLAGAMLVNVVLPARWVGVASIGGLGLIAASVAFISSETEFPGLLMLAPTAGACLLLLSPGSPVGARLLSSRALVWIGLISYPLYLWHWPLLSLLRNFERAPGPVVLVAFVAGSVALAAATRRLVERPLVHFRLRPVAMGLAGGMLAAVTLTAVTYASAPIEGRAMSNAACTSRYAYQPPGLWSCLLSKNADPTVLVLGDSHAHHLYEGLAETLPSEAVLSIGACPPMIGLVFPERADATGACFNDAFRTQSEYLNARVINAPSLRWIVLSAMWRPFDASGNEIDYWSGKVVSTFRPVDSTPLKAYVAALERQVDRLGAVPVTIVLDTPRRGLDVETQRRRQEPFRREVIELSKRHANVRVFDPMPVLCTGPWCRWNELRDANHLTRLGSVTVAAALVSQAGPYRSP